LSTETGKRYPGAFGIAIDSDGEVPGLAAPSAVAGGRFARHRLVKPDAIRERCGQGTLTRFGSDGEGRGYREYHRHSSGGELMRTKAFGDHLIADGGRTILSAVKGADRALWQRFVIGQVLPVTASVQGLEIFHASAVSTAEGVIAFAGPSGVGKSTLAAAAIDSGASFYADDVLAADVTVSGITAYPGPGLRSIPVADGPAGEDQVVWSDEARIVVDAQGDRRAHPIRAFVALVRDETADRPLIVPCPPNRLMASTFDALPRNEERLRRLLRVCAELALGARALELRFSSKASSEELVEAVFDRLGLCAEAA
jgi:hypothetical protein